MFKIFRKKIGLIGCGNMGSAIAEGIKAKYPVFVFDKDKEKTGQLCGVKTLDNIVSLAEKSEVLLLAVKPQDFDDVLNEIKGQIKDKLIISIAAGITTRYIENILKDARVIRVMPNIGAKIGEAESTLCKGKDAKEKDLYFTKKLFNLIGKTWIIQEALMNAATSIVGSGPAYIFYDIEVNNINPKNISQKKRQEYIDQLKYAAEKVGFDPDTAVTLAQSTTASSITLLEDTGVSPANLRKQVTSKGGTTEAALEVLTKGGSWADAASAAARRAKELSKE